MHPMCVWACVGAAIETLRDGNYVDTTTRMLMQVQYANPDNSRSIRSVLCQPVGMVSKYAAHPPTLLVNRMAPHTLPVVSGRGRVPGLLEYNRLTITGSAILLSMPDFAALLTQLQTDAQKPFNYTAQARAFPLRRLCVARLTRDYHRTCRSRRSWCV